MAIETTPEIAEKVESKPIICLKDVAIAYQTNVALFDVNLDIFQNDLFGICGPNGSGKSTLLKAIVGSIKPFRGYVKVFRKDISKGNIRDIKSKIGYLPQKDNIDRNFPALVKDVVGMGLFSQVGFFKRLSKEDNDKIQQALEIVEMENLAMRPIGHLSGGQQQKAMIAKGIVNNPEILLMDEPFSALDFKVEQSIMRLIKKIHDETNVTIVMITHSINFIIQYCNRAACLDRRIIWSGNPKEHDFDDVIKRVFFH